MHPLYRPFSMRTNYRKPEPKIALFRSSLNLPPIHACTARWKSSIQHLPTSQKNHSYETAITSPTALSTSQKLEKAITSSVKPAAAPTSIQKSKVYESDPDTLLIIDPLYPDWLKKRIESANSSEIPVPLFYKRMVIDAKFITKLTFIEED